MEEEATKVTVACYHDDARAQLSYRTKPMSRWAAEKLLDAMSVPKPACRLEHIIEQEPA